MYIILNSLINNGAAVGFARLRGNFGVKWGKVWGKSFLKKFSPRES